MKKNLPFLLLLAFSFSGCRDNIKEIEKYSIEQFMNNISVSGSAFSPGETKILFSSNESGIYNAYEIGIDGKNKSQLTQRDESTYIISYFPDDERILFSSDKGGNEISHIYVRETDGTVRDIIASENAKAIFAGWGHDQQSFFITMNERDPRYMDMYEVDIVSLEPKLFFENTEGFFPGPVSNDKSLIALSKPVTRSYTQMFLFNRLTKELSSLKDIEETIHDPVEFSADGKYLYYLTDHNNEFTYLVKLNLETRKQETVYQTNWDVMYAYHSYNEKYRVVGINQDAQTVIKIFLTETNGEVSFPSLPGKDITSVNISKSENLMTFYASSSKSPNDLYVYRFENNEYLALTHTLNKEINPGFLVDATVVRYKSFDGLEIPAILYKPVNSSKKHKVPALVWVHGGPGGQSTVGYRAAIQYLVNNGYAVIAVNNRGSSGYGKTFYALDDRKHGNHDLKDCIYAKNYLAGTGWVDTNKIGIIGGSYGGYMTAAALTFTPGEFNVGVNIFGVTNWLRTLKSIPSWWEAQRKALYKELGDPTVDSVYLREISPLFHAKNIIKPFMVLQGANDPRVLKVESDEIVEAAKANGVPVEYVVFDDEGHGFRKKENEIEAYGKILAFLDKYLKGDSIQY